MKKILLIALVSVLLLVGCGRNKDDAPNADSSGSSGMTNPTQMSTPLPKPEDVQFELNGSTPTFQPDSSQGVGNRVDLTQVPDYTTQGTDSSQEGDTSGDTSSEEQNSENENSISSVDPTEENKYPNTGMFLEDD